MRILTAVLLATATLWAAEAPRDSWSELRSRFAKPPASFSTMPFFVWNGEVTEADIDRHLAAFHDQGIEGFFIHPRPGLITPYLSDRWFELVRYTVAQAAKLGMEAWLYDENSYPSGFAGGHVPAEMPESWNQGQGLVPHKLTALASDAAAKCTVLLAKSGDGYRDVTAARAEQPAAGDYVCFELAFYHKTGWYGGYSYVDLIRPGVTEKFIDVTMRGYERSIGAEFGRTVPGIFTDEPNIEAPVEGAMRWTPDLFAQFATRRGYGLRPHLLSLFEETGDWRRIRHDYFATLHELFVERWSKPWHAYAEQHGMKWTGHYWEHMWPNPTGVPDSMAMYAWPQVPAIDLLFNQYDETGHNQFGDVRNVKELASVANQLGLRRTLSETYGGGGWELRFEDMKRLGDWEYVLGVNLMNQHLSFQTLVGSRKHDYPQSFTYHEPWWKHYRVLADYFGRLSLALATGEQVNHTLVLEPTTTGWMYSPAAGSEDSLKPLRREFRTFVNGLESVAAEYDIGSENLLRDHGRVAGALFGVGRRDYNLVVLPPGTANLETTTVALLESYLRAGGTVLSFVDPPARVDGAESARVRDLAAASGARWVRVASLEDAAARERLASKDFEVTAGKLYHMRRQLTDGELTFLVNSSLENPARATVRTAGRSLMLLDAVSGTVSPYPARSENGRLAFTVDLPPAGSLLVVASPEGTPTAESPKVAGERVAAASPLVVKRTQPNLLAIEYVDLKIGGAVKEDVYFESAAKQAFQYHGFKEGNPWSTAVQYKTSILDRDHFAPDSGFEAVYRFEVAAGVSTRTMQAVVERPALWKVAVNGQAVAAKPGAWWLDAAFGVYDIGAYVKPGANEVSVAARPMSVHSEIEPIYILGDFGVVAAEKGFRIVPATALASGDWTAQALPFYSHAVSYTRSFKLRRGAGYKVRLGKWNGTVAEVKVNGVSAGVTGWPPYELDISRLVRAGRNEVEVLVYGSLKNALGPHLGKLEPGLVSPWSWRNAPEHTPAGKDFEFIGYGLQESFEVVALR
jgi:hypothetical protein